MSVAPEDDGGGGDYPIKRLTDLVRRSKPESTCTRERLHSCLGHWYEGMTCVHFRR